MLFLPKGATRIVIMQPSTEIAIDKSRLAKHKRATESDHDAQFVFWLQRAPCRAKLQWLISSIWTDRSTWVFVYVMRCSLFRWFERFILNGWEMCLKVSHQLEIGSPSPLPFRTTYNTFKTESARSVVSRRVPWLLVHSESLSIADRHGSFLTISAVPLSDASQSHTSDTVQWAIGKADDSVSWSESPSRIRMCCARLPKGEQSHQQWTLISVPIIPFALLPSGTHHPCL